MDDKTIKLLSDLIKIESVSADPLRHNEMDKAADFLKKQLLDLGFDVDPISHNDSPPLILATRLIDESAETIAIYAHYDVQPEDPVEKWLSPPFTITERNGKLFGRGVADDKGHVIQIISAVGRLISSKKLNNNIILIFEGEEEMESKNFEVIMKKAEEKLDRVDVFYIFDSGMKAKNIPQIFYGLRGVMTGELLIKTGTSDLHSGIYGNRVSNPIQVIAELLAKIKDGQTNKVKIAGFYDRVDKIGQKEVDILSECVLPVEEEIKNAGVKAFNGSFLSSKILPSFEANGVISGYTGSGAKTIIPSEAKLKFSIRLVPKQKPAEIKKIISDFIAANLPKSVDYELNVDPGCGAFYTDFENEYAKNTAKILSDVFNNKTYFNRSGGSVAAAEILQRLFKKPIIMTGFTLPDENIHAPNENIDTEMFKKGIEALVKIISQ